MFIFGLWLTIGQLEQKPCEHFFFKIFKFVGSQLNLKLNSAYKSKITRENAVDDGLDCQISVNQLK